MKKFSKLVAVSAAAMTFGVTGVSALNNTNIVNADSLTADNSKLTNDINGMKDNNSPLHDELGTSFGYEVQGINKTASQLQPNQSLENIKQDLSNNATGLGYGYKAGEGDSDWGALRQDWQTDDQVKDNATNEQAYEGVYNDANQVLADLYSQSNQPSASNANKQTANNNNNANAQNNSSNKKADVVANADNNNAKKDNAQGTVANKQNANNNNNANAKNNSLNKKANVVANADNNAKKDNVQGTVANKQNTNNEANAQQNTVKSNANVEGTKTVANESKSNLAKNQNKGAIAETQNENTIAASETSTVVKAQAKSASNTAAQQNNTPGFPQTGEQASEILAVVGGLVIAATAAGIVVYKKRN